MGVHDQGSTLLVGSLEMGARVGVHDYPHLQESFDDHEIPS